MRSQTLPQLLIEKAKKFEPDKIALRQKELGIWREFTWKDSYRQVKDFSLGIISLGLERGDRVCGIGDNDREYLWGFLGLQAAGGVQVGLFTDATPSEITYIVDHSQAAFILAQDQEQCDKLLEVKEDLPKVKRVIYWDDKGMWHYDDEWLISFAQVQELGRALDKKEPDRFNLEVTLGQGHDLAVICYTSGTTGLPKGAMLSQSNLISASALYDLVDPRHSSDNHVSFLPLGWIGEVVLGFSAHVYNGLIINFPEEPETVQQNIREIAPESLLYNSRLWDNLVAMVQVRMNDATWINRKFYTLFLPVGYKVAERRFTKQRIGFGLTLANKVGDILSFKPLRDQLGLSNIRVAYTAGSALSPDAMRFFHALGINLKQIYGSTEVTGGATVHRDDDIKFASVGQPVPEVEIVTDDTGEILISGPTVFLGYFRNPEATEKSIYIDQDDRHWFRTGDAGYIDDDGHTIYLDRVSDMITLANGESFSPQFIEGQLKFSPYIKDVMAVGGEDRDFVGALVIIDFENVGHWAEQQRIGYTTFIDLSQKEEVYDQVYAAVENVNENLPPSARVKRFLLMHKEFDADEAEMTRTRKLRRGFLYDRYENIVEAMYDGRDSVHIQASVRYRDGSEGITETDVRIMSL